MLLPFRLALALIATALPAQQIAPAANGLTATTGNTTLQIFPERNGENAIALALDLLNAMTVPPALYAPVQLPTAKNVDQFYPKDIYGHADMDEMIH